MRPPDFILKRTTGFTYGELCWLVTIAPGRGAERRTGQTTDGISPWLDAPNPLRTAPFPRR
jgi:hypothetical protein